MKDNFYLSLSYKNFKQFLLAFFFLVFQLSFMEAQEVVSDSAYIESDTIIMEESSRIVEKITEVFRKKDHTFNYNVFSQLFPIRDNPTVGYRTSYNGKEKIIFDVHPVISLTLFNNFREELRKEGKRFSHGYSIIFRPHFRLYNEESTPVKMPSYRIMFGLQHLYKINQNHLVSYSFETGHYSNGQSGSAIIGGGVDGSKQSDSIWTTIDKNSNMSELINRENGDFSTNLTELLFNYRYIPTLDAYSKPKQVHSFTTGFQYYHNLFMGMIDVGGYNPPAIKVYGHWRYLLSYAYNHNFQSGYRIVLSENIEVIGGAHPSVNPFRSVTQATFFLPFSLGFFVSYIYGHDDYNLRFVDSGHQFGIGFTWDMFPPLMIGK